MRRWIVLFAVLLGIAWQVDPGRAAANRQVTPYPVEYTFGEQVSLHARLESETAILEVQVFLRCEGDVEIYSGLAVLKNGHITYQHDLTKEPLRAFSQVEYWFGITPASGEPYLSDTYSFFYEDNRYDWQVLSSDSFTIHWYEGELDFAQSVLNAAEAGLVRAGRLLELPAIQATHIYVYSSGLDMQSTLQLGGLLWIAGHADPELGVAVVSLPAGPDQNSETERQIPHEVMHLLLYQSVGEAYYSLPVWLKEGLASANESRPNPNYYVLLSQAVEQNTLMPMTALCQSFPQDTSVYQAYAQSDSFVRFLNQQYGQAGVQSLLTSYAAGQGCETASTSALGLSLSELEQEWRRSALNDNVLGTALEALFPWGALLLVMLLVPFLLVLGSRRSAPEPQPSGQSQ